MDKNTKIVCSISVDPQKLSNILRQQTIVGHTFTVYLIVAPFIPSFVELERITGKSKQNLCHRSMSKFKVISLYGNLINVVMSRTQITCNYINGSISHWQQKAAIMKN